MKQREVLFAKGADEDLARLFTFPAEESPKAAEQGLLAIPKALSFAAGFPYSCRKAAHAPTTLRECVISFGSRGYVAAFEIAADHILVLAVRHQREDDLL